MMQGKQDGYLTYFCIKQAKLYDKVKFYRIHLSKLSKLVRNSKQRSRNN